MSRLSFARQLIQLNYTPFQPLTDSTKNTRDVTVNACRSFSERSTQALCMQSVLHGCFRFSHGGVCNSNPEPNLQRNLGDIVVAGAESIG
jgi:hypothetical protein